MLYGLVGLLAWGQVTNAQEIITDDTVFYGLSPPVYPSPNGTGSGPWAEAYTKARAFVGQLTLEEKVCFASQSWYRLASHFQQHKLTLYAP
jgi:beta-glucosidase